MEQNKENRLNELFSQARNEPTKTSFEAVKGQFLKTSVGFSKATIGEKLSQFLNLKTLIMLSIITTVTLGVVMLANNFSNPINNKKVVLNEKENIENNLNFDETERSEEEYNSVIKEHLNKIKLLPPNLKELYQVNLKMSAKMRKPLFDSLKRYQKAFVKADKNKRMLDVAYIFPSLNEEEQKAHAKQKRIMFGKAKKQKKSRGKVGKKDREQWSQPDPKGFLFIPMGEYERKGEKHVIQAFYMKRTEVTNIEYRTFLFDLLRKGRKKDFLIAKPDQEMWNKEFKQTSNQPMVDNYFSHPAYDEYPAVGMSREGAEMYCKWFTDELSKIVGGLVNNVRLPSNYEWEYAARGGLKEALYPWGGPYIRNSNGCFLANFKPGTASGSMGCSQNFKEIYTNKEGENTSVKTKDDVIISSNFKNPYSADGGYHAVKVNSYNPNDFGLYCMSGNVAEMVNYKGEEIGTKGGSWASIGQELQIVEGNDPFKGQTTASVTVGFRPVITYWVRGGNRVVNDDSSKFPHLTAEQIKENNKWKAKMVSMTSKKTVFGYVPISAGSFKIDNKVIEMDNLYIKQTEVTNLQYKTFLFDLLIQGKKDDFLIAKPDQSQWEVLKTPYNKELQDNYFSNEKYYDYPVVNVSREGVLMYCKWLSTEINKAKSKKIAAITFEVRLPTDLEWMYAARGGKDNAYGWNFLQTRQNSRGCFLGNFRYSSATDVVPFTGCEIKNKISKTTAGLLLDDKTFTVKVNSYNPNSFKLYCMSGNVAEMVNYVNRENKIGTKGGGWNSTGENIKIKASNEYVGVRTPNINIGFRPIITYSEVKK